MSRGDKRERDRAKTQAKMAEKKRQEGRGGDVLKRNENDAAALQAKVAAKKAAQEQAGGASSIAGGPVPRKKVASNKDAALDDLLSAGLPGAKKRVK